MKKLGILIISCFIIASCQSTPTGVNSSPNPSSSNMPDTSIVTNSEFKYVGQLVDKTASGNNVTTDGKNDIQFSFSQNFPSEVEVKEITISRIENAKPYGVVGWSTSNNRQYWVLAVEANGTMLNQGKTLSLGKLSGNVKFNFYGSELGAEIYNVKNPGTEYQLDITYNSNGKDEVITKMMKF